MSYIWPSKSEVLHHAESLLIRARYQRWQVALISARAALRGFLKWSICPLLVIDDNLQMIHLVDICLGKIVQDVERHSGIIQGMSNVRHLKNMDGEVFSA